MLSVLMKDERKGVMVYGRQQLQFYIKLIYYNFCYRLTVWIFSVIYWTLADSFQVNSQI